MKCENCIHLKICNGTFGVDKDFAEVHGCDDFKDKEDYKIIKKPHCYGKMDWILKYGDEIPSNSICQCEYTVKCLNLTKERGKKNGN